MIPAPLRDHIYVRVDADKLDRTESGLYKPDWQPGDKDAQQAEVVALPISLGVARLAFPYMDGQAYQFKDLQQLPFIGKTVYLKPNTFKPDKELKDEPGVFLVPLDKVIAIGPPAGFTGSPIPFQGLLLCEPVYDKNVRMGPNGVRERVIYGVDPITKDAPVQEFVAELDPLPIEYVLRVLHTGQPLKGQSGLVKEGDVIVAHNKQFVWHAVKNKDGEQASSRWMRQASSIIINGKDYVYLPRQCVMAIQ